MPFNFQRLDNLRIALALVAAVITGGAALYGVATNAREATVASYETLAPEINELKQVVTRLEAESREMKQALAARVPARPAASVEARTPPRRPRATSTPAPGSPTPSAPTTSPPIPETPPATPPEATPPAAPAPTRGQGGVLEEVQKRVPIDFEKAREVWRDVKGVRK
jgi:hypothetical protein